MPNYRRILERGGEYFFTVNLADRRSDLLTNHIGLLKAVYRGVSQRHPLKTIAIVVLPDHLHAIWQLPEDDCDYAKRWRLIKSGFTRGLRRVGYDGKVWQNRYCEHHIRDDTDMNNHIDYIHGNPIRHGYVEEYEDWPYSSWHRYDRVYREELAINRAKWIPHDWGERKS